MTGWLIVNGFLESQKFDGIYSLLETAGDKQGIKLEKKLSCELIFSLDDPPASLPDFVLFWDKDYYLAKRLEELGVRVFNSAEAILKCDNKCLGALALRGRVKTPRTVIAPKTFEGVGYTKKGFLKRATDILGLPVVIKEAYGSFGAQVYLARTEKELEETVDSLGHKEFLMQELVKTSYGRDVRINIVGGRVVSSMMRYNDNDFRSNITNGGSMKKYEPSEEMKREALAASAALGLDFCGVDVLFGEDGKPLICEVNSNPHFKSTYECTGNDMSLDIMEYIGTATLDRRE